MLQKKSILAIIILFALIFGAQSNAQNKSTKIKGNKKEVVEKVTTKLKIWNKWCPVEGKEVNSKTPTTLYQEKAIGFCSPACNKIFKKDPEKYMNNLSEDGSTYEGNW